MLAISWHQGGAVPSCLPEAAPRAPPCTAGAARTSVLGDVPDPGQGLVAALFNDLQVAHLGHRYQGNEHAHAALFWTPSQPSRGQEEQWVSTGWEG